jgi:AcrR family transcriptional regulator
MASRARVVDAARALFEEVGFQGTTVRMIAERAGLSPGGVFTTFEDKVAILCQIVGEQREELFKAIEAAAPGMTGSARDRLLQVLAMAHADEFPRLRMVAAYVGASYGWSRKLEEEHRALHRRLAQVIGSILREGVERGDVASETDLDMLLEVLSSIYLRNYRTALHAGLDEAALNARVTRQVDLVFQGARPR